LQKVSDKNIKIIMGETSTELPDSLIPAATVRAERISRAVRRLSAAVQIELVDTDLSQADLDDAKREELARLGNEVLGFMHVGQNLLKSVVEAGSLGLEENGGGLPLRITAGDEVLELGAGTSNGDIEVTEPRAEEELSEPAEGSEERAEPAETTKVKTEAGAVLPEIEVIIDGFAELDNKDLGLDSIHEITILRALADLNGQPLTRKWMIQRGFYPDATSDAARNQVFSKTAVGLSEKFQKATGGSEILAVVGEKSLRRYLVVKPFKVDGAEVSVSDDVKKN
jgi:hypothetical protein